MDRHRVIEKLRGQTLKGSSSTYKLGRELGRGGNGVALLCKSPGVADAVVAKIYIPPDNRDLDDRALERFRNEITITTKIKHPHIVRSLDSSVVELGTYKLPFYIMPFAAATLRAEIRSDVDPDSVERKFRMFAKAARGVSFLHHHGIVHRDLKPENILIDRGSSPLVADLGIAHVNPDFVSVGLRTVEAEKLLNRDYYAPEQRFGSSTGVDHRADVYALGLILYELLTAIPPVRVSTPPLEATSAALSPLDPIWRRMTDWDPEKRFQSIDDALDDAWIALGVVLATMRGAAGLRNPDLETMTKLLRSNNDMQRRQGIEIATRLKKAALGHLHALLGHVRRDVRNSVATALGHIGEAESLPYLVAALYGNTEKPHLFRPGSEAAAAAIALYPSAEKLRAIKMVSKPVRPTEVLTVLRDVDKDEAVGAVRLLMKEGHLLLDWSETLIGVLVELDEDAVWPDVLALVRSRQDFQIREAIANLTPQRRAEALRQWVVQGVNDSWHFREQIRIAQTLDTLTQDKRDILRLIEEKMRAYNKKFDERESFLSRIASIVEELPPEVDLSGPARWHQP